MLYLKKIMLGEKISFLWGEGDGRNGVTISYIILKNSQTYFLKKYFQSTFGHLSTCMKRLNGNYSIKTGYWIIFVKKKWPMAVAVANHIVFVAEPFELQPCQQ